MDNSTRPDGHLSPREYATVAQMSEASVRLALRENRLTAVRTSDNRRWLSQACLAQRFALQLTSSIIQAATLHRLRMNAQVARVELLPDEELVANAEAYLRALNVEARAEATVEAAPVEREEAPVEPTLDLWGPVPGRELVTAD